jgi:hypothetical protein
MAWLRKGCLAAVLGGVLSTVGCCYHSERFGGTKDIGWGEIGCGTCCKPRCGGGGCGPCPPPCGSAGGGQLPATSMIAPSPIITAAHQEILDAASIVRSRSGIGCTSGCGTGAEMPVYVLPPDSVTNALLVSPNPLPTVSPRTTTAPPRQ